MEPIVVERAQHPISRRDIHPNVLKVLYRLIGAGYTAYLVGGGVRDLMLGRRPKDFDVATSAHPHQVRELFRNSRLIGRRFRLIHVFFGPQNIEVATFRRRAEDVPEQGDLLIHLDNTFGSAEEDAFRRDFTVNALFYDPSTFRVIDYVGGVAALKARLIRTIGDPELRMREDPVRMIRAVRFAAKLRFEIEPATRAAIERHRRDILKASMPRVVEEIYRTIDQEGAVRALILMEQLGLLEILLPRLSEHLRTAGVPLESSPVVRNMEVIRRTVAEGGTPSHALILSCMFLDLSRALRRAADGGRRVNLVGELRARGFARGDTEQMRLWLDAFEMFIAPSRRTRRLARRPYFADARRFYEMAAPGYGADPAALGHFLAAGEPAEHLRRHHPGAALSGTAGEGAPPRRRRRRRGGRRHRGPRLQHHEPAAVAAPQGESERGGRPHPGHPTRSD